jgi:hypothetical protein
MLEMLLSSTYTDTLTLASALIDLGASLALGLFISMVYMFIHRRDGYSAGFGTTLVMMPALIAVIIMLIGNNVARAFSLAGAFSLIRFRSAPGEPQDIAYVLFSLATGLACGMGYITYGAVFAVIICAAMVILHYSVLGHPERSSMQLKITVPEDMNYPGAFDTILDRYAHAWRLQKVKSCEFGTLFELVYGLNLKDASEQKSFLDELRCRNGNLNIVLTMQDGDGPVLAG